MNAPLLRVEHLTMRFGGLVAVDDVSFDAAHRQITAIIGPNGAGKTTVFNCIAGFYKPSVGRLTLSAVRPTQPPCWPGWCVSRSHCLALCQSFAVNLRDSGTNRTGPATLPRQTGQGARVRWLKKPGRAAEIECKGASGVEAQPTRKRLFWAHFTRTRQGAC